MTAAVTSDRTGIPVTTAGMRVLSLLWHGRLSWMRIVLSVLFGLRTGELVTSWHEEVPAYELQGWVLALVPSAAREALLAHPNIVGALVALLTTMAAIGLATRPALLALVAIGLFARAVEVSQGVFDHESSLSTQVLLVLVFAPGSTTLSMDRVIGWWRAGRPDAWTWFTAAHRAWGVLLITGLLALTYTASGLSKLRFGGLRWLDGETLGFYLRGLTSGETVYLVTGGPPTWRDDLGIEMYTYGNYAFGDYHPGFVAGIVDALAHSPAALVALSAGTVALELCGFLLFVPRVRSVLLVGYIGMHLTIGILMGLAFVEYQVICLLLLEWERIVPAVARLARVARRHRARRDASATDAGAVHG